MRCFSEIVRTLATEPPLLLLDEPVVGLSPPMRDRMMEIIRRLAGEEGIGIMLIEHVIDLVMWLASFIFRQWNRILHRTAS